MSEGKYLIKFQWTAINNKNWDASTVRGALRNLFLSERPSFFEPEKAPRLLLSDYKIQLFQPNCSSQGLTSSATECYKSYSMHNGSRKKISNWDGKDLRAVNFYEQAGVHSAIQISFLSAALYCYEKKTTFPQKLQYKLSLLIWLPLTFPPWVSFALTH